MAKHKEYSIGPISASHPTSAREARRLAEEKAASELGDDYRPYYIEAFGATLVVWREPVYGWTYQIRHSARDDHKPDMHGVVSSPGDRSSMIASALSHMADLYWDRDDATIPEGFDMAAIDEIRYRDEVRNRVDPATQAA